MLTNREYVNVFTASMAKVLLAKGYTIADLKKDKNDVNGKTTIFVFKNEVGLEREIKRIVDLRKK